MIKEKIEKLIESEINKMLSGNDTEIVCDDKFNQIGKYFIIRTYSAGVFFGKLKAKEKKEVIINECRRLYYWKTINNSISLSSVANHGLHDDSKVCEETNNHWMESIELIECSNDSIKNIKNKNVYSV